MSLIIRGCHSYTFIRITTRRRVKAIFIFYVFLYFANLFLASFGNYIKRRRVSLKIWQGQTIWVFRTIWRTWKYLYPPRWSSHLAQLGTQVVAKRVPKYILQGESSIPACYCNIQPLLIQFYSSSLFDNSDNQLSAGRKQQQQGRRKRQKIKSAAGTCREKVSNGVNLSNLACARHFFSPQQAGTNSR